MVKDIVTIVDKNDNVIGSEERKFLIKRGLIHRIVRVLLFNTSGQLYLQLRSPDKDTWPNKWDQSIGGHVDKGETYEEAVVREAKEELNISGVKFHKVAKYYMEDEAASGIKKRFNMLFELLDYDGEITLQKSEITKGAWFDMAKVEEWINEKPNDFTPGFIKALETYKRTKDS